MISSVLSETMEKESYWSLKSTIIMAMAVMCFLLSIDMLGLGLGQFADARVAYLTSATNNPFVGLFIGLLVTAVLQSSSTTTSLAVAAVASQTITLSNAIPIILGANIGTTITSTVVAFGFITKGHEFRKAMSAAMAHDMFNIIGVLIIFPLELHYNLLERSSFYFSSVIPVSSEGIRVFWVGQAFDFIGEGVLGLVGPILFILMSVLLLFGSIKMLSQILYGQLVGKRKQQFQNAVFKNPLRAFGWGLGLTSAVQSSSLTTSLIVPLVATGKVRLDRAFQFLMGANIGTTITAILAALFRSEAAMSLAITHFLFNCLVVLIFVSLPFVGRLPLYLAEKLGYLMFRFRVAAFAYITLAFFAIPFALIYLSQPDKPKAPEQAPQEQRKNDTLR